MIPDVFAPYITVQYSTVLARSPTIHRGLECASVFEFSICLIVCLCVGKYYHLSPHPPLSPLLLHFKNFAVMNPNLERAHKAWPNLSILNPTIIVICLFIIFYLQM